MTKHILGIIYCVVISPLMGAPIMGAPLAAVVDLGVHGPVFPIKETSLLDVIYAKLKAMEKTGALKSLQASLSKKAEESIKRPRSVVSLPRATVYRRHRVDPTLVVEEDLSNHQGTVFAKKGTRLNPLDYVSWGEPLLLIDGDDEGHVAWVKRQSKGKIVLVKGSPFALETVIKRPVYFDQGGRISKRFGLRALPVRILQQDKHLLVEETPTAVPPTRVPPASKGASDAA